MISLEWNNHYYTSYISYLQAIYGIFAVQRSYIIIILFGATSVMHKNITLGMLFAYIAYHQQFVSKAQNMVDRVFDYQMISLDLERVADIALTKPEQNNIREDITSQKIIQRNILVRNLAFRYSEQDPYIFKELNFEIKVGETAVIVGPSGCGKTTLIKILMQLLVPTSGDIYIDGIDIKKMGLGNYRSQIAAVMQEDVLLKGSIAENICFFDPKPDFSRIYDCAIIAAIHEDILHMPMSYQSLVGDAGSALSGGQKQRVLLARALYAQPIVLFLDEATNHLDSNNEDIINQRIKQIGITRIIVAHKKETMGIANRVIYLEALIKEKANIFSGEVD